MKIIVSTFFICLYLPLSFSQGASSTQAKEDSLFEPRQRILYQPLAHFNQKISIKAGYSTNPRFTSQRKGDTFQELLYSANYNKKLSEQTRFFADYLLDAVYYNELSHITHGLNFVNAGLEQALPFCDIGLGYNAGFVGYPKNDGEFILHNGYAYIAKQLTRNTYHRLKFEYGRKDYFHRSALDDTIDTYQDKERLDRRLGAEYAFQARLTPKISLQSRSKFLRNDSNAIFEDFYDYKTYQQVFNFKYRAFKDISLYSQLNYRRKEYDSRTVASGGKDQADNLYIGSLGVSKSIGPNTSLSLEYTYRENSSNEPLEEYSESAVVCGWNITF